MFIDLFCNLRVKDFRLGHVCRVGPSGCFFLHWFCQSSWLGYRSVAGVCCFCIQVDRLLLLSARVAWLGGRCILIQVWELFPAVISASVVTSLSNTAGLMQRSAGDDDFGTGSRLSGQGIDP